VNIRIAIKKLEIEKAKGFVQGIVSKKIAKLKTQKDKRNIIILLKDLDHTLNTEKINVRIVDSSRYTSVN
tara:strand:+ start:274 stop:483 length:210 start_codon:yes stop_codon:yes gene_type:complete